MNMTATTSTAYSRDLGDELRRLRKTCTGMNGHALAVQLGWDPSKVSNIEHGKIQASEIDLVQYLTVCGKDVDFVEDFRIRYRRAFEPYIVQVPDNLRTIAMAESMAKKIIAYDVMTVNGLVQTEPYARQLFVDAGEKSSPDIEKQVRLRMDRQSIMRRPVGRPECVFYVHELALKLRLGNAKLMEDQYLRLLFDTHVLRIVPASVGSAALQSKCTLFEFDKADPIVFTETDVAQVFAQDAAAVERGKRLFERLDAVALDEERSRSELAAHVSALRKKT